MKKHQTGAWETMTEVELLGELSYAQQLGHAGELRAYEIELELKERWTARQEEEAAAAQVEAQEEAVQEEAKVIEVFYEQGYKWTVFVQGEEESRETNVNKKEAMDIAREVKKELGNAIIKEQRLTKKEKAANISYLHQTTETYHDHYRYL